MSARSCQKLFSVTFPFLKSFLVLFHFPGRIFLRPTAVQEGLPGTKVIK